MIATVTLPSDVEQLPSEVFRAAVIEEARSILRPEVGSRVLRAVMVLSKGERRDHERRKPVMLPVSRQGLPTTHYLLPHERYAAPSMLRQHRAHPDGTVVRQLQEKWGPQGIVLLAASQSGGILGAMVVLIGAAVLVASGGRGAGLVLFYLLLCLGLCLVLLALIRGRQRARAVKRFQSNRRRTGG